VHKARAIDRDLTSRGRSSERAGKSQARRRIHCRTRPIARRSSPPLLRGSHPYMALEAPNLPGRTARRPYRSSLCAGRADQRGCIHRLNRPASRPDARPRRYRHRQQPRQPQRPARPTADPKRWGRPAVPAALQPRPEPHRNHSGIHSDRWHIRQAQDPAPKGR
jgi:hypothetical protein